MFAQTTESSCCCCCCYCHAVHDKQLLLALVRRFVPTRAKKKKREVCFGQSVSWPGAKFLPGIGRPYTTSFLNCLSLRWRWLQQAIDPVQRSTRGPGRRPLIDPVFWRLGAPGIQLADAPRDAARKHGVAAAMTLSKLTPGGARRSPRLLRFTLEIRRYQELCRCASAARRRRADPTKQSASEDDS